MKAPLIRFIAFMLVAIASPTFAQQLSKLTDRQISAIDTTIQSLMKRKSVPGVSVAVANGKDIIWSKGYGKADLENEVSAKTTTVYRLASVSKPITAVAVMQLVEQGKIDLDAPIQQYVPSFPKKKFPITTRQLLGHLSGVHHYLGEEENNVKPYKSLTEALDVFKNDTLTHKPEAKFTYSTYGYVLLGVIVESASGMSFMEYLNKNIFKPASMSQTFADDPISIIAHRARFYDLVNGKVTNAVYINSSFRWPGGGLLSTPNDLCRFAIALENHQLLKQATFQEMTTSLKTTDGMLTNYGFGWITGLSQHPNVIWHGGIQPGASTVLAIVPEKKLSVAILTNIGTIGGVEIDAVTGKIITIISGK